MSLERKRVCGNRIWKKPRKLIAHSTISIALLYLVYAEESKKGLKIRQKWEKNDWIVISESRHPMHEDKRKKRAESPIAHTSNQHDELWLYYYKYYKLLLLLPYLTTLVNENNK
jgi:hypothetical protein